MTKTKEIKRIGVFAGSFDPVTIGHLDIVKRATKMFDQVKVLVAINGDKNSMYSPSVKSLQLIQAFKGLENVDVDLCYGLVTDYIKRFKGDSVSLVRGVRNSKDFEYEFNIANINRMLGAETVFIPTKPNLSIMSSTMVKELKLHGQDVSNLVPKGVVDFL